LSQIDPAKLRIIKFPDPRLRKVSKPVVVFDDWLAHVIERMLGMMHQSSGIGLAAPQVALPLRLFVCNVTGDPKDNRVFINPSFVNPDGMAEGAEGCLSVPDVTITVRRHRECDILAQDVTGKPIQLHGTELEARCWQHEYDHLDGRLIVDYMSEGDKLANRRILKQLDAEYQSRRAPRVPSRRL
jgi:peptide deformylase